MSTITTANPAITGISPNAGSLAGGTQVTINGTGFTGATAVNFGQAGATNINVQSDSVITVTSPNTGTAGTVDVTVFVNSESSAHSTTDQFTYSLPTITALSPSAGSLAGGATITITGQYFTGAEAVNFGLAGASDITVLSDTQINVTNPNTATAGVVDVTVIVQGQTSAISTADQFTYSSALAPGVPILFAGSSLSNTYIQFIGGEVDGIYYDSQGNKQTLAANTAYSLMSIASGTSVAANLPNDVPAVLVNSFSGRLYVSMGTGLSGMSSSYTPSAGNPLDPNYQVRYQYFEPTIVNSQMNVDLSYIDFSAISLSLSACNAPHAANGKQISQSSLSLATATGAAASTVNGSVLPAPADQLPSSAFARVISPQLGAGGLYHDFTQYLKTTLSNATVRLCGTYVGTGAQPSGNPPTQAQSYDYTATFDTNGNVTLAANTGSGNGSAPGVPTVQRGPGVGDGSDTNMSITFADLNASTGIYGCNAPYTLGSNSPTAGITNDVYGQVVGDLLAGLNFGYVGSQTVFNGVTIGSMSSTEWWGGILPDGASVTPASSPGGNGIYFQGAQLTRPLNYNSYAGTISTLTTGYGFPLQDRLGRNLMTMNTATDTGSYLMVWVDITPVG